MTDSTSRLTPTARTAGSLTAHQLEVWCDSIAQGESAFPADVSPADFERLVAGVGRRRRQWLINFIADAIANDIVRANALRKGSQQC